MLSNVSVFRQIAVTATQSNRIMVSGEDSGSAVDRPVLNDITTMACSAAAAAGSNNNQAQAVQSETVEDDVVQLKVTTTQVPPPFLKKSSSDSKQQDVDDAELVEARQEEERQRKEAEERLNSRQIVADQIDQVLVKMNAYKQFFVQQLEQSRAAEAKKNKTGRKKKQQPAEEPTRRSTRTGKATAKWKKAIDSEQQQSQDEPPQPPSSTSLELPKSENTISEVVGAPKYMTGGQLRDYQIEGVHWMNSLYLTGVNGILADEMGLGKTIQAIAMVAHVYEFVGTGREPLLVVAPLSTLKNWHREFQKFTPDIPVILYHGAKDERRQVIWNGGFEMRYELDGRKVCPTIITSYETVMADVQLFSQYSYKYFVLDEGHRIKNYQSLLIAALKKLTLRSRLLMTGAAVFDEFCHCQLRHVV